MKKIRDEKSCDTVPKLKGILKLLRESCTSVGLA
jgi:hypothetical protein